MTRKTVFTLTTLLISMLASCAVAPSGVYDLSRGWFWAPGVSGEPAEKALKREFTPLKPEDMGSLEAKCPDAEGFIWLRIDFFTPTDLPDTCLGLYLGRIFGAEEALLNGVSLGVHGRFPPEFLPDWNTPRFYSIPSALMRPEGKNVLLVRLYVRGEGWIDGAPFIASREKAESHAALESWRLVMPHEISAGALLVVAIACFVLSARRGGSAYAGRLGLVALVSALVAFNYFFASLPYVWKLGVSWPLFRQVFGEALGYLLAFLAVSFAAKWLKVREHPVLTILRAALAIAPLTMAFLAPDLGSLSLSRLARLAFFLPPLLYLFGLMIFALLKRRSGVPSLLAGFAPAVLATLADAVMHWAFPLWGGPDCASVPPFLPYAIPLSALAFFFIALGRNDGAPARDESGGDDPFELPALESVPGAKDGSGETADRRADAFSGIQPDAFGLPVWDGVPSEDEVPGGDAASASDEVPASLADGADRGRRAAGSDAKLAETVQQGSTPRLVPRSPRWDVAFAYRPGSAISVEGFDFYVDSGGLSGLCLFGTPFEEGVAAALSGMLVRSLASRAFYDGIGRSLGSVMTRISGDLARECAGLSANGVVLRFSGDMVEYANAGHPDIMYRATDGKVSAVNLGDRDVRSASLGTSGASCDALRFRADKGSVLVVCGSGVVGAKDSQGERFGERRLGAAIAAMSKGNAEKRLQGLLAELEAFCREARGDATIVVMVRK